MTFHGGVRLRRMAGVAAGAALVLCGAVLGASCGSSNTFDEPPPGSGAPTRLVVASSVPLGVYIGPGDVRALRAFALATDIRPSMASDYLPGDKGWKGMVRVAPLRPFLGPWQGTGYRLVLAVPIIPTRGGTPIATLAGGAAGDYDAQYTTLARTLVSYGQADAVIRPGWEFNGTWYPWSVNSAADAANYAAYFRHIVDAMRAVPGTDFQFAWNPTAGASSVPLTEAYPGNAYVDYIGLDLYDQVWGVPQVPALAWAQYQSEPNGLRWLAAFAAAHHKDMALPEWGVALRSDGHGLGDDPAFVRSVATWIATHDVAFTSYFEFDASDGDHDLRDGQFPRSLAAFRHAFAATVPTPLASEG